MVFFIYICYCFLCLVLFFLGIYLDIYSVKYVLFLSCYLKKYSSFVNIYYEIFRENPMMERRKDSSFAQNILIYINENYDKKITLKLLSEHFHISADYISHEFRKIYGISPINYVIDRRLNDAKWLLINTNQSLVSISEKVGYENTSYFSKLFEKRIHYSPLEFREKYKK